MGFFFTAKNKKRPKSHLLAIWLSHPPFPRRRGLRMAGPLERRKVRGGIGLPWVPIGHFCKMMLNRFRLMCGGPLSPSTFYESVIGHAVHPNFPNKTFFLFFILCLLFGFIHDHPRTPFLEAGPQSHCVSLWFVWLRCWQDGSSWGLQSDCPIQTLCIRISRLFPYWNKLFYPTLSTLFFFRSDLLGLDRTNIILGFSWKIVADKLRTMDLKSPFIQMRLIKGAATFRPHLSSLAQ